jgi:hypothetical protein
MTTRVFVFVVVWVAAVAGCTTPSDPPSPPASSRTSTSQQQGPRNRDEEAVLAALRRIDLCEVLDAAMATTPGLPAGMKPETRQPFECVVNGLAGGVSANVVTVDHAARLALPSQAVGNVKAYVREDGTGCDIFLPVSFELAVEFSQTTGGCQVATGLAAASVTLLADPEAARVDPRWDACTVLAEALGPGTDRSTLAGQELDDCTDFSETPMEASISFANGLPPSGQSRTATIGSTQVQIYERDTCEVYWRQGPLISRFAQAQDHPALVSGLNCPRAEALAESVMKVLAEPPPSDAKPQQPLFYAPDEPDSPWPGACAYADGVSRPGRCAPHRAVPVPDDIAKSFDAQVMCTVAADAVGEHFGTRLRPVAVTDSGVNDCYFVEPERTIQLVFVVKAGPLTRAPDDRDVTIAGHPGYVAGHRYRVSTSREVDTQATVQLTVLTGPVVPADIPLPAGTDEKAEAVLADVLEKYFP